MIEELLPNLFVIYSPNEGGNSYLLVGKKNILVDTSLGKNASYLKESIEGTGLKVSDINTILHTHGHADHFSADYIFPKAEKLMHQHDAEKVNRKDSMFSCASLFGERNFPKITGFLENNQEIINEPFSLKVIETPGHTKGSVCFYEGKNKLLFSGDCLFRGSIGRYDLPSASKQDTLKSLKKLLEQDYKILLPGHGTILNERQKENIQIALEYLEKSVELGQI